MIEFWVLLGGSADTPATRIVVWAECEEEVADAFPRAARILRAR